MSTYYKFDNDGWYAGEIEADTQPENTTTISPDLTDTRGHRWDGSAWNPFGLSAADLAAAERAEALAKTVFTKLQIRRAMRSLGIEDKLNTLLASNATFNADWTDAQAIDLADSVLSSALSSGGITATEIESIKLAIAGIA
jgi:hypothetical protein